MIKSLNRVWPSTTTKKVTIYMKKQTIKNNNVWLTVAPTVQQLNGKCTTFFTHFSMADNWLLVCW